MGKNVKQQVKQSLEKDKTKTTKAERRRKFNVFKDRLHGMYGPISVYGGIGETKPAKVMSNEDRRKLDIEEDPALPDYQGKKNEEEKKVKKG